MQIRSAQKHLSRRQTLRAKILDAAAHVVSRHGYAGASIARIAERASVAHGSIYTHFSSRQALLNELLPREGAALLNHLSISVRGSADYFDMENKSFSAALHYMRRRPYFLRILNEAETAAPESFAAHMRAIEDRYLNALRRGRDLGQVRAMVDNSYRLVAEILAGARGHILIGLSQTGLSGSTAATAYMRFIRRGFRDEIEMRSISAPQSPSTADHASPFGPCGKKALLLTAATELIGTLGFSSTTVRQVTEAAGVSVGTFYSHFISPVHLLAKLLEHTRMHMLSFVRQRVRGARSFVEMEYRGFVAFFEYLTINPHYLKIESEAAVFSPEAYHIHFQDISTKYVTSMQSYQALGQLREYTADEFPTLSFIFMAARHYLGAAHTAALTDPTAALVADRSEISSTYRDFLCQGLEAQSAYPQDAV